MSETPEQRTKRVFLGHLEQFEWDHQISLFYQDYADCFKAIEHSRLIRKIISREYPRHAFLWRMVLGRTKIQHVDNAPKTHQTVVVPYHTYFFHDPHYRVMTEEFTDVVEGRLGVDFYGKKRRIDSELISGYTKTIKNQAPHDFHRFLRVPRDTKIRRFSLLNKKSAIPVWRVGMPLPEP